jgi:RNA recognition motif-containing protein
MRIYVGNLSFNTTEDTLRGEFASYGEVADVAVVTDRDTGRSRGFAFVTMSNDEEARRAIAGLNGSQIDGRTLVVNEARPREGTGGGGGAGSRDRDRGRRQRRGSW